MHLENHQINRASIKWIKRAFVVISLFGVLGVIGIVSAQETTSFSGVAYFAGDGECMDEEGEGADFALNMTGDLEGCLYVFVAEAECRPHGQYVEVGTELYVGSGAPGDDGTFETVYRFLAAYEDCPNLTGQIHGRCHHPIVSGSGTGDYRGIEGRFNMVDDVVAGNVHYSGFYR